MIGNRKIKFIRSKRLRNYNCSECGKVVETKHKTRKTCCIKCSNKRRDRKEKEKRKLLKK